MIKKDRIYVEDLRVKGTIGIFDWEKKIKQEISLSYEIDHDNLSASKEDKIEATTDYKTITKKIIAFIEDNKFELVETFAEKIADIYGRRDLLKFGAKKKNLVDPEYVVCLKENNYD